MLEQAHHAPALEEVRVICSPQSNIDLDDGSNQSNEAVVHELLDAKPQVRFTLVAPSHNERWEEEQWARLQVVASIACVPFAREWAREIGEYVDGRMSRCKMK